MFVVGAVERPRRQHDADRLALAFVGRHARQRPPQPVGIVIHRGDSGRAEKLGKHPHHDLAVLQHVGDPRRRAAIVLEHEEVLGPGPHQVDADDVAVDPPRRIDPDHGRLVGLVAEHQIRGDHTGPHDLGAMVDVPEEGVQRPRPLLHAALQPAPLGFGEDPRHHVEGNEPLGVAALAIDREGDADAPEQRLRLLLLQGEQFRRRGFHPVDQGVVRRANPVAIEHLVEAADDCLPRTRHRQSRFDRPGKGKPIGFRSPSGFGLPALAASLVESCALSPFYRSKSAARAGGAGERGRPIAGFASVPAICLR